MEALKIEILNPKALQLIKGMQELKLIKVSDEPASALKLYLKKMRQSNVPIGLGKKRKSNQWLSRIFYTANSI